MSKVFIAAGHGNVDPGAVSQYGIERDIAIGCVDEAVRLAKLQDTKGREVVLVPDELGLENAIYWINARCNPSTDLCMEVHLNSNSGTPGTGTETYYGNKTLADEMNQEIVGVLGLANRGVKQWDGLMFNNSTNCASCLIELGFVNNSVDVKAVVSRGGLALAKGIVRACGGIYKEATVTPQVTNPPVVTPTVVTPPTITPTDTSLAKDTNQKVGLILSAINWLVEQWKKIFK